VIKFVSNPGAVVRQEMKKIEEMKPPAEAAKQKVDLVKDVATHADQA
jgi:hypothetical protein